MHRLLEQTCEKILNKPRIDNRKRYLEQSIILKEITSKDNYGEEEVQEVIYLFNRQNKRDYIY